jgi:heme/copper-type cytochrome/quinol oxidase subunit 4
MEALVNKNTRLLIAFLIAPISFSLLLFIFLTLTSSPSEGLWVFQFNAILGYPLALFFGVPLYILLSKFEQQKLFIYFILATAFSLMFISYFVLWPTLSNGSENWFSELFSMPRILQMSVIGFACMFTIFSFWLIARPDLQ